MPTAKFSELLQGGDLRSIGKSAALVKQISNQAGFNQLFQCLYDTNRIVVMRSADALEKITRSKPEFLIPHKQALLSMMQIATNKELKWHLAQLIARLELDKKQIRICWKILSGWSLDKNESKIVRANSLTTLHHFSLIDPGLKTNLHQIFQKIATQNIPSLNARIKKLNHT